VEQWRILLPGADREKNTKVHHGEIQDYMKNKDELPHSAKPENQQ
jgi:hypothetical protein